MDTFHFAILQLETFIKIYKIFQRDDEEEVIPSRDSAAPFKTLCHRHVITLCRPDSEQNVEFRNPPRIWPADRYDSNELIIRYASREINGTQAYYVKRDTVSGETSVCTLLHPFLMWCNDDTRNGA